jgi:hypothetical protein
VSRANPWWPFLQRDQPINWLGVLERFARVVEVVCNAVSEGQATAPKGEAQTAEPAPKAEPADPAADAAKALGVDLSANADDIRAALRRRMAESRVHPDQGGDADLAKRLIAAKNLLVERIRGEHAHA